MGTRAWPNVYEYVASTPTRAADPSGLLTAQIGVGGSVIAGLLPGYGGAAAQGDVSVAVGVHWDGISFGSMVTGGAGTGVGVYGGGGLVVGITTAPHVGDLKGRSTEIGLDTPSCSPAFVWTDQYWGGQVGIGPGAAGGARVTVNGTIGEDIFLGWGDIWRGMKIVWRSVFETW